MSFMITKKIYCEGDTLIVKVYVFGVLVYKLVDDVMAYGLAVK